MIFRILLIAWIGVRSRLGRSVLTALSLFLGVLAIVVIQAGAGAAQDAVVMNAVLTGGRAVTLCLNAEGSSQSLKESVHLAENLSDVLVSVSAVSVVTVGADTQFPGGSAELTLFKGDLRSIRPFPIRSGEWINSDSDLVLPVVANEAAGSRLGLTTGMTSSMRIGQISEKVNVRIIGIVADGMQDPNAYAALDLTCPWVNQLSCLVTTGILVHVDERVNITGLTNLIRTEYARIFETGTVPEIHRIDQEGQYAQTLTTIRLIFSAVAGLSLIVGSMGILNIGLSTLRERSDELSLRRSFGATRSQIIAIIVLEGQIVAVGASVVAICIGLLSFPLVASFLSHGMEITLQSFPREAAAIGVAASCGAAFVGSLAPAIRASRVPIVSIMRT